MSIILTARSSTSGSVATKYLWWLWEGPPETVLPKNSYTLSKLTQMPSVLWHYWLGIKKSIGPVMRCWRGCLSAATCKWFAYGPGDATATTSSLASLKSRRVSPFWAGLHKLSWKKRLLNGCVCLYVCPSQLTLKLRHYCLSN